MLCLLDWCLPCSVYHAASIEPVSAMQCLLCNVYWTSVNQAVSTGLVSTMQCLLDQCLPRRSYHAVSTEPVSTMPSLLPARVTE